MRRRKYKDEKGEEGPFEHKSPQILPLNHITPDQLNSKEIGKTPIDVQSAVLGTIGRQRNVSIFFHKIIY